MIESLIGRCARFAYDLLRDPFATLLVCAALLALCPQAVADTAGGSAAPEVRRDASSPAETEVTPEVPQRARDVLAEIQRRNGEPPAGHVGGRTFGNRERRLPRGSYREYDVNPKVPGRNRGTERIVIERRTGKAYYTRDHYETFVPMN